MDSQVSAAIEYHFGDLEDPPRTGCGPFTLEH